MTLTTHAIAGAAIAASMPHHPIIGFTLAFASHFILDAIPHWDYALSSSTSDPKDRMNDDMAINGRFLFDLLKIGLDVMCGMLLTLVVFDLYGPHLLWVPLVGACGAILPDALQFVYWKWRREPLVSLQRFHLWIHAKLNFNEKPLVGIPFQAAVIALIIVASRML